MNLCQMYCIHENKWFIKVYILFVAIIVLYFCSECGPLYYTNFWTDANIYFTIGRGMKEGLLPYVDLYDHKGPIIYFLHMLAAYIDSSSFIGVWFIEIIAAYFSLYITYKLLELFCKGRSIIYIPLIALVIYCSCPFVSGDSAEELCLPVLAYSFYTGLKAVKSNCLPSRKESFFIGLSMAYVFWLKYTMVGFFLGFAAFFLIHGVKHKLFPQLISRIGICLMGFILVSLSIILIFVYYDGLCDLLNAYFFDNILKYSQSKSVNSIIFNLANGVFSYTHYYLIGSILPFLGWMYLLHYQTNELFIFSVSTFIGLFLSSYAGGRCYQYYSFVFSIFTPVAFCLADLIVKKHMKVIKSSILLAMLLLCFLAQPLSNNKEMRSIDKSNYFLEPFAKLIREEQNPSLICYGVMDLGLYNYCDIIPQYKFFCLTNIRSKEINDGVKQYIENSMVDYIFTANHNDISGYKCVLRKECIVKSEKIMLYLYKRKA